MSSSLTISGFTLTHAALNATQGAQISPIQRLCLSTLAGFCNVFAECWPSNQTIADRTGLHERTVSKAIGKLQEAGLIERESRGYGRAMLTRILLPLPTPAHDLPTPAHGLPEPARNLLQTPNTAHEPPHQHTSIAVSPPLLFVSDLPEQPEQPTPALPDLEHPPITSICHTEALKTTYSASNEADKAIHTLDPATPVVAPVIESDPAMAEWAKVDPQVIADLQAIRKEKRKKPAPTKTEIQSWYEIARAEGWTLPQLAYALVLKNWSRVEPGWLQHVPRPQMTATGAPVAPAAPKVWQPEPHTPASASTLAKMREQIAQMKARWREEPLKAPPIRR